MHEGGLKNVAWCW